MNMMRALAMIGLMMGTASCAPKPAPEPERPPVRQAPTPPPPRPAPPPAPAVGWEDMALTPGDWVYSENGPSATYGAGLFTVRCDRAARRISLVRSGAAGPLVIRTSYAARTLNGAANGVVLPVNDPFLEQMIFSRGRIAVEAEGQARLILPSWAEPARVVEECRS
ncbi:MAG TPA: hypothetical protein VGB70_02610 [Allosphingosinicella sp.]|jgi:hypothetical protein